MHSMPRCCTVWPSPFPPIDVLQVHLHRMLKIESRFVATLFATAALACRMPAHAAGQVGAGVGAGMSAGVDAKPDTPLYSIVHVDIEPAAVKTALPILQSYAKQAEQDPAVLHIDVLQQDGAKNHFTLVEVLRSPAAYDTFVEEPYVKDLRNDLQPFLGSPFDERLHQAVAVR